MASISNLIWIALPNGFQDGRTLRLSVYLAPALAAPDGTTVAQFHPFDSWPDVAAGIRFQVSFDNGFTSDLLSAMYDTNNALDTTLWKAIFGGDVRVGSHVPLSLDQNLSSFDARTTYETLHGIYIPDPSELPPSNGAKLTRLSARLRPSTASPTTREQKAFARFLQYHKHRAPSSGLKPADNAPPNTDVLDFHSAISAISRYSAAMRALGFVFDLTLPLPANLSDLGTVFVQPVSNNLPAGARIVIPRTAYSLDTPAGVFALRTNLNDPQHQLRSGMLFSDTATLVPIELDAFGLDANNAISTDSPDTSPKPTPRNAGLSFTLPDLDQRVQDQIASGFKKWTTIETSTENGNDVTFFAEDLVRGYRVDVGIVETNQWHSLCRRSVIFDFGATKRAWNEDEGLVGLGYSQQEGDPPRFYPMQLRWHGWSLSVPRPGKTIGVNGGADDQNQVTTQLLPFQTIIEPVAGSLPRLRFGPSHYRFRLRTVDLAGNSLPFDAPIDNAFAMPPGGEEYLRVDPVLAPVLLMRDPPGPGESVERMVIISDIDVAPVKNCERLVAMPKAPVQTAEWLGMFDTSTGVNPDAATYQTVVKNSGKFDDAPYGNSLPVAPDLPYLPDPMASGAAFFPIPPAQMFAPPQPYTNWPNYSPFRLQLGEASTLDGPNWDEQTRTATLGLPKAAVLTLQLSTYPANVDLLEPQTIVKRAPIKDNGGKQAPIANLGSVNTPWTLQQKEQYHQLLISGQNPDISPHRSITFVHAVTRPLQVPTLDAAMVPTRPAGATYTEFRGNAIPVDGNSTSKVEILAQWDEPVDDGVNPPSRINKSQHVSEFHPDTIDQSWPLTSFPLTNPPTIQHEFGDTKRRTVTYQALATTRFLEYLDPAIQKSPEKFTVLSNKVTLDIPASAPPPAPRLLYAIPTFRHQDQDGSRVRTAGIRIYVDRPWFASGDGELLAVLLHAPPQDNVVEQPETDSVWGTDPRFASAAAGTATPQFLTPDNFKTGTTAFQGLISSQLPNGAVIQKIAMGFTPTFLPPDPSHPDQRADPDRDPHNGRWFFDLEIEAENSYLPMLRLALARLQPNTPDASPISSIVIANIVPLTPNRTATVTLDPASPNGVAVTVAGPTVNGGTASRIVVTAQVQPSPGLWVSLSDITLAPADLTQDSARRGTCNVPVTAIGGQPMRVLIREFEQLSTDAGIGERLVYGELISL